MEKFKDTNLIKENGSKAFFYMIALYVLISIIASLLLLISQNVVTEIFSLIVSPLSMAIVIINFSKSDKTPTKKLVGINKFSPVWVLGALLLSVGMFFGLGFINELIAKGLTILGLKASGVSLNIDRVYKVILYSILLAVLPAIVEETFFRGLILHSLRGAKIIPTVLTSALVFALYHGSATQLVYQFIFGCFLALLTIKSKSVIPAIISHFINNFAIIILTYFKVAVNLFNPYLIALGLICLFGFICICVFYDKPSQVKFNGTVKGFYSIYFVFATCICLIFIIGGLF